MDKFKKLMEMLDSGNVFSLNLNMNDVFAWGCAESGEMDSYDIESVFPIYEKYGYHAIVAYECLRRNDGSTPAHGEALNIEYLAAKEELSKLAEDGTILYEQFYDRTHRKK